MCFHYTTKLSHLYRHLNGLLLLAPAASKLNLQVNKFLLDFNNLYHTLMIRLTEGGGGGGGGGHELSCNNNNNNNNNIMNIDEHPLMHRNPKMDSH